jgi:hypothetical protein
VENALEVAVDFVFGFNAILDHDWVVDTVKQWVLLLRPRWDEMRSNCDSATIRWRNAKKAGRFAGRGGENGTLLVARTR